MQREGEHVCLYVQRVGVSHGDPVCVWGGVGEGVRLCVCVCVVRFGSRLICLPCVHAGAVSGANWY